MKRIVMLGLAIIVACCGCFIGQPQARGASRAVPPLLGPLARGFDPPDEVWNAGHRGVDIEGSVGAEIVAAMSGTISFTGMVAGRPVITINHQDVSTTYEPVTAVVTRGTLVGVGDTIGTLEAGHPCPVEACLHWGLKQDDSYLDPLSLLTTRVRLMSAAAMKDIEHARTQLSSWHIDGAVAPSGLTSPTTGSISSPYGMRLHPIWKTWSFHNGLDIAGPCGTPIVAAASGVVTDVVFDPSFGHRLLIDHTSAGLPFVTGYNHAQGYLVTVGDTIIQGQVIGRVGATGDATGCHLHFQVWNRGTLTDPAPLLPGGR